MVTGKKCPKCGSMQPISANYCSRCTTALGGPHPPPEQAYGQQKQVIVVQTPKSVGVAYALLIFLGQFGLHRFYLGHVGAGITQLALGVVGWGTSWLLIGFVPLVALWIWLIIDLFLVGEMVREANQSTAMAWQASRHNPPVQATPPRLNR